MEEYNLWIVHLSDLHILCIDTLRLKEIGINRETAAKRIEEQERILPPLVNSLVDNFRNLNIHRAHLIITGDISYTGSKPDFDLAKKLFFDPLIKKCNDENIEIKFHLAPGNHDIFRRGIDPEHNALFLRLVLDRGTGGSLRELKKDMRNSVFLQNQSRIMANYYKLVSEVTSKDQRKTYPYFVEKESLDPNGFIKVNFLEFNSASLFHSDHFYYGFIWLDTVKEAFKKTDPIQSEDSSISSNFNISYFHHPFEAQIGIQQQEVKSFLLERSNIILMGHVHHHLLEVGRVSRVRDTDRTILPSPVVLKNYSRCILDDDESDDVTDRRRTPGYSIMNIKFNPEGPFEVDTYEVVYNDKSEWIKDRSNWPYPVFLSVMKREIEPKPPGELASSDSSKLREVWNDAIESYGEKRYKAAKNDFLYIQRQISYNSDVAFNVALCEYAMRDLESALKSLEAVNTQDISVKELKSAILAGQGVSYYKVGEWKNAVDKFTLANDNVKLSPDNYYLLGNAHRNGAENPADYEKALTSYKRASEGDPNNQKYIFEYAMLLRDTGHGDEAIEKFKAIVDKCEEEIKNNEHIASYHGYKGTAIAIIGDRNRLDEAIRECDKAIEHDPDEPAYYFGKGIALINLGKEHYKTATDIFNKAIELDQKNPYYYSYLGLTYSLLGEKENENAIKNCEKSITIAKSPLLYGNLAFVLKQRGKEEDLVKAEAYILKARDKWPYNYRLVEIHAEILAKKDKSPKKGLSILEDAIAKGAPKSVLCSDAEMTIKFESYTLSEKEMYKEFLAETQV